MDSILAKATSLQGTVRKIWVPFLYLLAGLALTYPIPLNPTRIVPLYNVDVLIALWNDWWFRKAITSGADLFFTPYLFYPYGISLATHSNSPLFSAVSALWFHVVGPLGAYNFTLWTLLVVGGVGMYLLVRDIGGDVFSAFTAGLVFAFAPYHLTQALAHPNLGSVQCFPYIALFLRRTMRYGGLFNALGVALSLSLTVWSGLHLGLLAGLWTAAYTAWTIATDKRSRRQSTLLTLITATAVAALLSAPALAPILKASPSTLQRATSVNESLEGQTDLLAYITPPCHHPLFEKWVAPICARFMKNSQWIAFIGFVPLSLAVYAAVAERRESYFWWISGCLWVLFALGSFPRINGKVYLHIQLPYALLDRIFPFSALRSSDRFNLLVPLSTAPLVGIALSRMRLRGWNLLIGLAILFEYLLVPIPAGPPLPVSPFLHQIEADTQIYAILDLPMGRRPSKHWMYLQTIHNKPIVEGMVARLPPDAYTFIDNTPLLKALHQGTPLSSSPGADLCTLENLGIRYIFIHPTFVSSDTVRRWLNALSVPPSYQDEHLIVLTTRDGCAEQDKHSLLPPHRR